MEKASATMMARKFREFLEKVENGRSIEVLRHGRTVARLVPDCDFMEGPRAAELFRASVADPETAEAVSAELSKLSLDAEW